MRNSTKAALLIVALGLASLTLAAMALGANGLESQECPKQEPPSTGHPALLTIKALHMVNQPIRPRCGDLARGPIWDLGWPGRPGDGLTMVIDAHDVTPVPGYGAHGPFYRLYTIKPGELAKIKWHGVWRTYRFVTHPFAKPQILKSGRVNNKPIKNWRGEVVYFRCCWPRYTRTTICMNERCSYVPSPRAGGAARGTPRWSRRRHPRTRPAAAVTPRR